MKARRHIEREFGVPIAGEILPQERWTNTAFKKIPEGHLNWQELFGRQAPVVLDLGCGNGRFLIGSALWRPTYDHLGLDILPVVIRYGTRRGNQRGLGNLRFAVGDASSFMRDHVAPGSVTEIHCYHPQPYFDPDQVGRRLMTPEFLVLIHRALSSSGTFFVQTDNPGYWSYMKEVIPCFFEFQERHGTWPDAPKGRTRREIIALRRGLPVFRGSGVARSISSLDEARRLAETLPPPRFSADRHLRELDEMEANE
jgi:tRNA (guanine-N7-)-methyltransferase